MMKKKLAASVLFLSAAVISPDLLWRLQVLLARLAEVLASQTGRTTIVYRQLPVSPPAMSRATLDINVLPPEISSIAPSRGPAGTTIVIRGSGFTSAGNTVYASYGVLPDLSSPGGRTITLRVDPPGLPPNLGALKTTDFPELRYRFYLRNANGETGTPGEFVLDL